MADRGRRCWLGLLVAGAGVSYAARGVGWAMRGHEWHRFHPRASTTAPTHLVVLAHGLSGTRRDLAALERELRVRDPSCLPLAIASNEGRTRDGIIAGAQRLAHEVRATVSAQPSLRTISFVGNSLGGLYVREAARLLNEGARFAGLEPAAFITIASPHLGVRSLFWVPAPLQPLAPLLIGQTARDLFLQNRVLEGLTSEEHLVCLRHFTRRVLFANGAKDWMVPAPSAAIDAERAHLGERERALAARLGSVGWASVPVALDSTPLPLAHNMICALSRDRLSARVYRGGLPVVREVASAVLGGPGVWSAWAEGTSRSTRGEGGAASGVIRLPPLRI